MPNAAYVLSGEITVEEPSGIKRHFSAGEVIPESVNHWHRGVVGVEPAVFIAFYAGVKGMPPSRRRPPFRQRRKGISELFCGYSVLFLLFRRLE
jgi:hypothetical protein